MVEIFIITMSNSIIIYNKFEGVGFLKGGLILEENVHDNHTSTSITSYTAPINQT
jgi:hypothetical protein